jgi:DNA-binding winged helix-turn-helix (wHTH) protein
MNPATVLPLNAVHAVAKRRDADRTSLSPVRARFDRFELDEANARLLRDGKAVALARRPFSVLCALARRPGSLVTKNALLDEVWGHQFVSDSALKSAISELRMILDDDPRQPRFIETVSRRGYRFIPGATALSPPPRNTSTRESGCELPQPVYATSEEVRYAHALRLVLRARFLGLLESVNERLTESLLVGTH